MAEPHTPNQPAAAEEKLFTLSQVSQRSGISMPTLQRYKKTYQDRIPSVGTGRKQRYPEHALPVFAELRSENAGKRGRPRKNAAAAASTTAKRRPAAKRAGAAGRRRTAAAGTARRRPGRPRKVQPAAPARRGRPPGRPRKAATAARRGRPPGRRTGRVGRPPGSGRRTGRVGRPRGTGRAQRAAAGRAKTAGLLTLTQISKTTGISYPTLVRYVRLYSKRLAHEGKGRARRFYHEAVDEFRRLRAESGRGGRRAGGRRAAPGTARRGRPPKSAVGAAASRVEAVLAQRVRDLEKFRKDIEKRLGGLAKGLRKLV